MTRLQWWTASLLAGLALLLMAASLGLGAVNRSLQAEVGVRQQYVQQSLQLETLYREIIRALAELGARNNDQNLRDMLQRHGITYNQNAPAVAASPATAAPGAAAVAAPPRK
jgi:hypothetical protein